MENVEQTKQLVHDLAYYYEKTYGCCSQCVLGAIKSTVGNVSDSVFKASTGFGAGLSGAGYSCGALTGGIMAINSFCGREFSNFPDPQRTRFTAFRLTRKLVDRFEKEYGSADCRDIQTKLMGRSFDILKEGERDLLIAAGGHDTKCTGVCGKSAAWVIDILNEEGLL
ncbi:hypothetical protein SDC9_165779 [bioreactor metagenome]|uniref:C_GCAxxG_C_C family protein n=1 Tax=bioreactor metagenome TaxID=1076179 RepID=A0A645FXR4_9ZZZZ